MNNKIIAFINLSKVLETLYITKNNLVIYNEYNCFFGCSTISVNNPYDYTKYINYNSNILLSVSHNWQIPTEIRNKTEYVYDNQDLFKSHNKPLFNYLFWFNGFYKSIK
jgi:hypothetical protein